MPSAPRQRQHDIVLFGGTGFAGGLTAEYLAAHAPAELRWALAGRNRARLEALRTRLTDINAACAQLPLLEVELDQAEGVAEVVTSTRLVITTVGPYLRHGEALVAACAAAGTDYVDLTGEPEFVDTMWLKYHEQAVASGARIVHSCGFDSIPHDLGAWYTVQQLPENASLRVEAFVRTNGGFSAGTLHSAIGQFARLREAGQRARHRREREGRPSARRVRKLPARIHRDAALGTWVVPMPTIDPQIVRRSARALGRYGPDFGYAHYLQLKNFSNVVKLLAGLAGLVALARFGPTRRWLLARKTAGEGPSVEQRARSRFSVRFRGRSLGDAPREVVCEVSGGDPGYTETAKMLAESALCLACDELPTCAGQVTTAQAMGGKLVERLQRAGIVFKLITGD